MHLRRLKKHQPTKIKNMAAPRFFLTAFTIRVS
jgi:hypothetical protein